MFSFKSPISDDIPIQAGDDATTANQLVSISEETETDPQIGTRNALIRSSKEILKTHKVPFPGFKKNKDKDKDKDKEKEKEGKENAGAGKSGTVKNGNLFSVADGKDGLGSTTVSNIKQLTKKDKRASLQSSVDAVDIGLVDKTSPTTNIKRKSSSIDLINSSIGADGIPLQPFPNGSIIVEERIDGHFVADGNGIADTTNGDGNNVSQRASVIIDHNNKIQTNMQVSQV